MKRLLVVYFMLMALVPSLNHLFAWAQAEGKPLYQVVSDPYSYAPLEKPANKLMRS